MNIFKIVAKLLFLIVSFYVFIILLVINSSRKSNIALEENVNQVLHPYEIDNIECEMNDFGSRVGKCLFSMSSQKVEQIARELEFEKYIPFEDIDLEKITSFEEIPRLATLSRICEEIQPFNEPSSVEIYQLEDDPKLSLKPGRFDYLIIYHHQKNNKSCIQVGYSYG